MTASNHPTGRFMHKACTECGNPFHSHRDYSQFCSTECRTKFNNRRRERGAQLYDLMMIVRHERGIAKLRSVWSLATRLMMYWKEQDNAERGGRRSWLDVNTAMENNAWANSTVVAKDITMSKGTRR